LLIVLSILFASCSKQNKQAAAESAAQNMVTFTDSAGRTVKVPAKISRIAPSGALAQIFLTAIAPDEMVCVATKLNAADAAYLPENMRALPLTGQFYGQGQFSVETLAKLDPQVIIDVGEYKKTEAADMDKIAAQTGIPAVFIAAPLDKSAAAYRMLGKLLGREARAEKLAAFCEMLEAQTQAVLAAAGAKKTSLLYCQGPDGTNVLARGSYHAQVLDKLADNAAVVDSPSAMGAGNTANMEQLMLWNPDVIDFAPASSAVYKKAAKDRAWSRLTAIKNGKYFLSPHGPYDWFGNPPSVNRLLSEIYLSKLLYPAQAEFDIYAEVKQYYDLFYSYNLTKDEFTKMTGGIFK
jgi:iron complex transport system substrate-binding protein